MRFAQRDSHQIFLEPEGLDTPRSIRTASRRRCRSTCSSRSCGRCRAASTRTSCGPATAIEYDYFDPRGAQVHARNQGHRRACSSPGQINGTTGYEEAAAQGLLAGVNAARFVARRGGLVPAPRRGVSRRAGRRSRSRAASPSRTGCSRRAPNTGCNCARTTPTCGSPSTAAGWDWSTTRAGTRSAASATPIARELRALEVDVRQPATCRRHEARTRSGASASSESMRSLTCCAGPA